MTTNVAPSTAAEPSVVLVDGAGDSDTDRTPLPRPRPVPPRRRRRRKVLVLTTTFPGRPGDGIPPFVLDLSRKLSDDYELTVVTPRIPDAPARERIGTITVERFAYFPRRIEGVAHGATLANVQAQPWRLPELAALLVRFHQVAREAASRIQPDLVHAHWLLPTGVHATAAAKAAAAPLLVTIHGVDVHALPVRPLEMLRRWTLRRTDHAVAVSSSLAGRIEALSPTTTVDTVPMGANLDEVPADFARHPEPGLLGFVGRLAEKKGVSVLLDALAAAPDLRLVIAGDGPDREALEAQTRRLRLDERVEFWGHADRDRVYDLLSRCESLVIPSVVARDGDQEGTPVVLAEAVALGVPVIASRLGGIADHLDEESGWLTEPGDPQGLATTLAHAHGSPIEREARATTARKLVSPLLTLDGTAEAYADLYRKLTGGRR
ncbi:MAG: glycosyltransferase [Actinomycetota bacterium]